MASQADTLITRFTMDDSGYQAGAKRVAASTHQLADAMAAAGGTGGAGGLASTLKLAAAELDSAIPILAEVVSVFKSLAIATAGTGGALVGFGGYAMAVAADIQSLELALRQYAGSNEEAERTLRRLIEVAKLPGLGVPEAIRASVRLQAVGFDARLAERAILAFGNALAASGGGKEELDGVILALSQIASKGQLSAEEINQMAERVPQIRQALKDAFGTASTEQIQKMGISAQDAIMRIIAEMEKLDKVSGGWRNSFANVGDVWTRAVAQVGSVLNTILVPALDTVTAFIDNMADGGVFGRITSELVDAVTGMTAFTSAMKIAADIGDSTGLRAITDVFRFVSDANGLGDGLVRVVSLIVAMVSHIPEVVKAVVLIVNAEMESIRGLANGIIAAINNVLDTLRNGFDIRIFGINIGKFGGNTAVSKLPMIKGNGAPDLSPLNTPLQGIAGEAQALYEKYRQSKGSSLAGDTSLGGFRSAEGSAIAAIEKNTRETAESTRRLADLKASVFGGSELGAYGVSAREMGQIRKGGGGSSDPKGKIEQAVSLIYEAATIQMQGVLRHTARG
jgi:tape measure domain-containing protein